MNSTIHDLAKVGLAVKNAILPAAMSTCVSEPGVVFQNVNYIRVASIVIIEGPLSGYGIGVILPYLSSFGMVQYRSICNRKRLMIMLQRISLNS